MFFICLWLHFSTLENGIDDKYLLFRFAGSALALLHQACLPLGPLVWMPGGSSKHKPDIQDQTETTTESKTWSDLMRILWTSSFHGAPGRPTPRITRHQVSKKNHLIGEIFLVLHICCHLLPLILTLSVFSPSPASLNKTSFFCFAYEIDEHIWIWSQNSVSWNYWESLVKI